MAGPFYNPAAGMGIEAAGASAVESPVAPVRTSGADAVTAGLNLASQGVAMYGQYQRSQGRYGGTRSGRPDPNVAVFAEEMNKVQQIRSEKGDLAGRLAERSVASNFAAAGVSLKDTAYQSVYESTTGRSFDLYGRDDDEYFRQKSLERPEVQAAFMASNAMLPPGTSTEERLEWSLNEVREQQAAVLKLSQAQNDATMVWQVGGEEGTGSSKAFRTVRQGFASRFSGGLLKKFEDGELVTPKDIAMAKVEWTTLKANALRRPPNLSGAAGDAQWRAFEAGNTSIDNLFTSLESATSNETFLNSQVTIIANEVKKSSSFSKLEKIYITAGLFSKDPTVYLGMLGETHGDLFKRLSELKISPTASPSDALNNPGFTPIPSSGYNLPLGLRSTVSYEIKDDEKTKYTGMTGKEIANQIIATAAHAKVFVPGSMSKAENREAFGKTMTGMIAALQSSDQKDFFSPAYLRNHVLNPTILATLEAYKKSDPDQADLLRGGLQLGYQMEKTRQQQSLSSIEARENIARYTRFNEETNSYELNVNEFSSGFAGSVTAFNDALRDHYNNNISEAARDKFDKIVNTGGRVSLDRLQGNVARNVVIFADLDELTHAVKRRDAIAALDKGIFSLDPEPRETELDLGQTMSQAPFPPASEQPADQGIDTSPRPTDESDGRSLLQRGLEMIFSPAASSELTPELRAQLEAVRTRLPPTRPEDPIEDPTDQMFLLPSAALQTSKNEDPTPKGQRFEPHIDGGNVYTLGGGLANLENVMWNAPDKFGFKQGEFYNKAQMVSKISKNTNSKAEILKGLDPSEAVFVSGPNKLSRVDYQSNQEFFAAAYEDYEKRMVEKIKGFGFDADKLNRNVKAGLVDYFWNMSGSQASAGSSGARIAKAYIDGDEDWYKKAWEGKSALLDNISTGGKPTFGLAKRRAIHYNMMGPPEGKGITKITLDKDKLNYIAEDGSTLYSRPGKVTTGANLNEVAKEIQTARAEFNELTPREPDETPETLTDAQFIEQMSKSLSETPAEKRTREAKARLDARTAYYKSLND